MNIGQYRLKEDMIEEFNSTIFDYGLEAKDYTFEVISKSKSTTHITYMLNLYDKDFNFIDSLIKNLESLENEAFKCLFVEV